jgi:hypothetical protein
LQTVIQVSTDGESLRERIAKDAKLEDYSLVVSKQRIAGRNPGWAKLYSLDQNILGVVNLIWYQASSILELVAKLTSEIAMRDDGTSQQHERFMGGAARLLAHPQLPELVQP